MSWSIEITGSKDGVAREVNRQLDKIAGNYSNSPEGGDVAAAKDRILALIGACALGRDDYGTDWNAIMVKASGSHGTTNGGITSAGFSVSVTRAVLAL